MAIALKSMTRQELKKLRVDVDRELKRTIERDKKAAFVAARKAAREHGFTLSDLTDDPKVSKPKKKPAKKSPAAPKYQHPEDPSATWTGKGRQPNWIKEAETTGKSRDEFLIKK